MSEIRSQATPAREELLENLRDAELPNTYYHQDDGYGTPAIRPATSSEAAELALDVVEAAGWSKPLTVTSATELTDLPKGTIVRDRLRGVCEIQGKAIFWIGNDVEENLQCIELPATVLFTPEGA